MSKLPYLTHQLLELKMLLHRYVQQQLLLLNRFLAEQMQKLQLNQESLARTPLLLKMELL